LDLDYLDNELLPIVLGIRAIIDFKLVILDNILKLTILPHVVAPESVQRPEIVAVGDTPNALAPMAKVLPFLMHAHALWPTGLKVPSDFTIVSHHE
jgi:hypothetical protein